MEGAGSKLKVLYFIDSLAPGGAERSLAALAPTYAELGVALDVAVLVERDGVRQEIEETGARVHSIAGVGGRAGALRRATSLVRECRPDLVHTTLFESDLIGRIAGRSAGTQVVSSLVNEAYGPEHRSDPSIRSLRLRSAQELDAFTARLTVRLHAVSHRVADVMAGRLRYPKDRIDVVARGRDADALGRRTPERRAATRAALGIADGDVVVLATARHEHQKALDRLVSAIATVRGSVPRVQLLIAGREGNATPSLRGAIASLGMTDEVRLLGDRSDVPDLLCAADVFALPSVREGMPGAVIEAMALEAPIVATRLPQVLEVTGDDGALHVAIDDVHGLARAIVETIEDPEGARLRTSHARLRFVENFTIERTARQMIDFYRRALGTTSEPASC